LLAKSKARTSSQKGQEASKQPSDKKQRSQRLLHSSTIRKYASEWGLRH